jgi:hypothetical protein
MAIGSKPVQQNNINWSYLNRGNVALNHTNNPVAKHVFKPSMIDCKFINVSLTTISGAKYPPKNNIIVKVDINTIEQYSPRKKKTNIIEECSVKKPATNSDS